MRSKQTRSSALVPRSVSRLTTNESSPAEAGENDDLVCNQLQSVTFNASPPATVRHETMAGKNYLVVPMVMITEGVHAGSNGPLYYPAEELQKNCAVWNHKPIVVYHPTLNGQAISACEPHVINQQSVGIIMNTRYIPGKAGQPGKLKADAYLEEGRLKKVDPRVAEAVQNKAMMEVSTGLFTDNEQKVGQWKKEQYDAIARNHKADHLAILPDQKGSCSIADGGGLMRNSAISHDEIRQSLSSAIKTKRTLPTGLPGTKGEDGMSSPWVRDVYDTFCIYSQGGKMYKHDFTKDDDGNVSLKGSPEEVQSRQTYTSKKDGTVLNTAENQQSQTGVTMDREEVIEALIANEGTIWDEGDRPWLTRCNLVQFNKLAANAGIHKEDNGLDYIDSGSNDGKNQPASAADLVKPGGAKGKKKVVKKDDEEETKEGASPDGKGVMNKEQLDEMPVEEFIANHVPAGMRDLFASGIKAHNRAKAQLVKTITANKRCPWTPDELMGKPLPELEGLAALAGGEKAAPVRNNYYGLGEPGEQTIPTANQRPAPKPLGLPTFNFERAEK